ETQNSSPKHIGENEQPRTYKTRRTSIALEIAGTAVFSALSIILAGLSASFIPRVPFWQIAYFDPVSLIWISAYFLFGFRTGVLTSIIGAIGLIPFDPSGLIGPVMKFSATIWFILIPELFIRIKTKKKATGAEVSKLTNYLPSVGIAWIIRVPVMIILNFIVLNYFGIFDIANLAWFGNENITGWNAIIIAVILLNTWQTIWDVAIPYILIFTTKIYDQFRIW
ncbi:MAG: hypothetical protein ACTSWW_01490, partial [Promethearchaeota archaeon]